METNILFTVLFSFDFSWFTMFDIISVSFKKNQIVILTKSKIKTNE